jgi:hypothetical protein
MTRKSAHHRGRYKKTAWTEADSTKLTKLLKDKTPYREVARILGKSRSSCEGHAFRMGLTQSLKIIDEEPLNPTTYKTRRCLYCMGLFESTSAGNRLCGPCKRNIDRHR